MTAISLGVGISCRETLPNGVVCTEALYKCDVCGNAGCLGSYKDCPNGAFDNMRCKMCQR